MKLKIYEIKRISIITLSIICQLNYAQIPVNDRHTGPDTAPIISGLHTLSIHVRDTITHDSVYQFLVHKLGLPVYYTPVKYGIRKYVGLYAGNMVLEPCGPYPNITYGTDGFRSIFFGMNFETYRSLVSSQQALKNLGLKYQDNQSSIYINDRILSNENLFVALYEVNDKEKRSTLRDEMTSNQNNILGLEYIKEIHIGYKEDSNLQRWKDFLSPLAFIDKHICQINDSLQLLFSREGINEVKGITFKVRSLEEAVQNSTEIVSIEPTTDGSFMLDQKQTFGLSICLSEEQ